MKNALIPLAGMVALAAAPVHAELAVGTAAPDFSTPGALGGKAFAFHLAEALKQGPVVLYFYPKAFTQGCTLEAHAFAATMPEFRKAGASVLGLSADKVEVLKDFSTKECSSAFPVGVASDAIIKAYDAPLRMVGVNTGYASRTTYVIGRNGRVAMVYTAMDYSQHVPKALAAVKALSGR